MFLKLSNNAILNCAAFLLYLLCFVTSVYAQQESTPMKRLEPMNTVYAELGGATLLWSINYERKITPEWFVRAAFAPYQIVLPQYFRFNALNIGGGYVIGTKDHSVEFGAGIMGAIVDEVIGLCIPLSFCYRYQHESGLFVRAGLTPLILKQGGFSIRNGGYSITMQGIGYQGNEPVKEDVVTWLMPWAGLSLGWSF